jgi:serine/threonine protein kinase
MWVTALRVGYLFELSVKACATRRVTVIAAKSNRQYKNGTFYASCSRQMLYAGIPPDASNKDSAAAPVSGLSILTFEDGLGWRYRVDTGADIHTQPEILCFRSDFTNIPSFEFALRERVAALSTFRHDSFARIRGVARLNDELAKLGLVSEFIPGVRLSEMLAETEERALLLDIGTAMSLIRQLLSAVAFLHRNARVAHGALGPERVIVTREARVFVLEFALGSGLEQLRYSRERHWKDLRIALPAAAGIPKFNECADITQLGTIALSLVLGRPLRDEEYLAGLEDVVASASVHFRPGWSKTASSGLRDWLRRMLQLDPRHSFSTLVAASAALEEVLVSETYNADPSALKSFLARYHGSQHIAANTGPASWTAVIGRPAPGSRQEQTEVPVMAEEPKEEPGMAIKSKPRGSRRALVAACLVLTASAGILFGAQRYLSRPFMSLRAMGTLEINTNPQGAIVFVDGVQRGQTPAQVPLDPGQHTVEIRADGQTRTVPVAITAGATVSQYLELPKTKAQSGQLQVSSDPSGARVSVDGQPRGTSPLIVSDLTPGDHVVTLESDLGSISQAVRIEPGLSASLIVPLAPKGSSASGWLKLSAPVDMELYERGKLLGTSAIDRIMLPAGKHDIEIVNDALGYRSVRTVNVSAGKTSALTIDLPKGVVSLNATPWATVWIDGQNVGDTPIGNLNVALGDHEVVFRNPQFGEHRRVVTVTLHSPVRVSIDLKK